MAKQDNLNPIITLDGVDYSSQIASHTLARLFEALDTTCYGDTARRRESGLTDGTFQIGMKPNDDLTNLMTISALGGTVFAVTYKPDDAAIAAGNPEFQFNALMDELPPLGGTVGDLMEPSFTLKIDGAVTVDTTP